MKKSSSKFILRASSVRNIAKVPFKFRFLLNVESVEKLTASGDVVLVWERNQKMEFTKPAKVDRTTRRAVFNDDRIACNITMYKTTPNDKIFQDKVIKLALRTDNAEGKTLGKIHINLADYVEIPSASRRIGAELSNGATLVAVMQFNFISMGKSTDKSEKQAEENDNEDEEDEDSPADAECKGDSAKTEDTPAAILRNKISANIMRAASKKIIRRDKPEKTDSCSVSTTNTSSAEIDKLRKENMRLKMQVEEMEKRAADVGSGDKIDAKLFAENQDLRRQNVDLQKALAREPVYADVVKDLKEAKMALALLHLEKEEVSFELMKHQKGSTQISPISQP